MKSLTNELNNKNNSINGERNINKRVAVVIPAFNAESTLAECLCSLDQSTKVPDEIIVVDDASTDLTPTIAKEKGCTVIDLPKNSGPARARNVGAASVQDCDYLCFVDSDIVVEPDTITRLLSSLEQSRVRGAVSGVYSIHLPRDFSFFSRYKNYYSAFKWRLIEGQTTLINTSIALVSWKIFTEIGGFMEHLRLGEDLDLGSRISKKYEVHLDHSAQALHLKSFTFASLVKDTFNKGKGLALYSLMRDRNVNKEDRKKKHVLSYPFSEIAAIFIGLAIMITLLLVLTGIIVIYALAALILLYGFTRARFIKYFFRIEKPWFAFRATAYMIIESFVSSIALIAALKAFILVSSRKLNK